MGLWGGLGSEPDIGPPHTLQLHHRIVGEASAVLFMEEFTSPVGSFPPTSGLSRAEHFPTRATVQPLLCSSWRCRIEICCPPGMLALVKGKRTPPTVTGAISRRPHLPQSEPDVHLVDVVFRFPLIDLHTAKMALDLITGLVQPCRPEETVKCQLPEVRPVAVPGPVGPLP